MAWKSRGNTAYWYQSQRKDGRVRSEYLGRGPLAELVATLREAERCLREAESLRDRELADRILRDDWSAAAWFGLVSRIVGWLLEGAGYHRVGRGPWRKRRKPMRANAAALTSKVPPLTPEEIDNCEDVYHRAAKGDESALPALRRLFDACPDSWIGIARADLAELAEETLVNSFAGKNLVAREGLSRRLAKMREELAGPKPTAVERLLVERVIYTWADLYRLELEHSRRVEELPPKAAAEWERRRNAANSRHLAALRSLAAVRRLGVPRAAIQVNVGTQQPDTAPSATIIEIDADSPARPHLGRK
jgi:hypothetical protein